MLRKAAFFLKDENDDVLGVVQVADRDVLVN